MVARTWTAVLLAGVLGAHMASGAIVINEIVYRDGGAFAGSGDWIELFNDASTARDVSGWQVKDDDDTHVYTIPAGTIIPAYGYLVVYGDANFASVYPGVTNRVGPFTYGLGMPDAVRVFDDSNDLKNEVAYKVGTAGWPNANGNGYSIELVYPYQPNNQAAVWRLSQNPGGSPGVRNPGSIGIYITTHNRQPDGPTSADQAIITIKAYDAFATISSAAILVDRGTGYHAQSMALVPLDQYTATLPAASNGTVTRYYFVISNTENAMIEHWWNGSTNEPYLFVVDDAPYFDGLVINEIMYRSLTTAWAGGASYEYLEIYNANTNFVDVSYWRFEDASDRFRMPGGIVLPPLGFLVLADKTQAVLDVYGALPPNAAMVELPALGLRDSGELLVWQNANGQMLDQCVYGAAPPWPVAPAGSGPSLELRNPTNDRASAASWGASAGFGSPGRHNSLFDASGLFSIDTFFLMYLPGETTHTVRVTSSAAASVAATVVSGAAWLSAPPLTVLSNSSVLLPVSISGSFGEATGTVRLASVERPGLQYDLAITVVPEPAGLMLGACAAALITRRRCRRNC